MFSACFELAKDAVETVFDWFYDVFSEAGSITILAICIILSVFTIRVLLISSIKQGITTASDKVKNHFYKG